MTPRPLLTGDRVMILDGVLPTGWVFAIADDRCTVLVASTGRKRTVFCDQVIHLAPPPCTTTILHEGRP